MRGNPKQSLDSGLFHAVESRFQVIDSGFPDSRFQLLEGYRIPLACEQAFRGHSGGGAGKGRSRTYLKDCFWLAGKMPLSLETMGVQIKRDQWNKRFRTLQVYWGKGRRLWNLNSTCNSPVAPRQLSCQISTSQRECKQTLKNACQG